MPMCKYILGASATALLTYLAMGCLAEAVGIEPAISRNGIVQRLERSHDSQSRKHLEEYITKLADQAGEIRDRGDESQLRGQIPGLQKSARQAEQQGLSGSAAIAYLRIGELYFVLSDYGAAAIAYKQSLRASKSNASLLCSALSHLIRLHASIGNKVNAATYSRQAQKLCGMLQDPRTVAELLEAQGENLYYSNEPDGPEKARVLLLQAKSKFAETSDLEGQGLALLYAAYAAFHNGDTKQAVAYAEEAISKWSTIKNWHGVAQAHSAIGFFWVMMSDSEQALSEYSKAQPTLHRMGDRNGEAAVTSAQAEANLEIGNFDQAYIQFQAARLLFSKIHDFVGEAGSINGAARSLWALQRYDQAANLYRAELQLARRISHARTEIAAYLDLAGTFEHQRNYGEAKAYCSHALRLAKRHPGYGEPESLRCLGHLYAREERYEDALRSFNQALGLKSKANETSGEAALHYEISSMYWRQRKLEAAKSEIENSIAAIEAERTKVSGFEDRATYFASVHEYYQLYVDILMELDAQQPQQNYARQALEAWEKSKVRSLLDMLASNSHNSICAKPATLLTSGSSSSQKEGMQIQTIEERCQAAMASALTLSQIQEEIRGDDSLLVEYALGKEASYVWVVDDKHLWSYRIPDKTVVVRAVVNFQSCLQARQDKSHKGLAYLQWVRRADQRYQITSRELAQLILGPISHLLNKNRIIIVPDGPLQYVPFAALPFSTAGEGALIRDSHDVVNLPSASTLKFIRDAATGRQPPTTEVAIFADPVFGPEDPRISVRKPAKPQANYAPDLKAALRDVEFGARRISRLPKSGDEAQAVVTIMGNTNVKLFTGLDANLDVVRTGNLGQYRHIVFATHGLLDARRPERSGLVLSLVNDKGEQQDGYLRLKDIYQLQLSAELVVLSTCESALGKDMQSEGIIGLTRAFLYAGSKRVISSLWKVDDQATAELMKFFFQRIHQGESAGAALRGAQMDLSKNQQYEKPYYWAGFILQGEYR